MKLLVHIDQKECLRKGINAPDSTRVIELTPAKIPEAYRDVFAECYSLTTGELGNTQNYPIYADYIKMDTNVFTEEDWLKKFTEAVDKMYAVKREKKEAWVKDCQEYITYLDNLKTCKAYKTYANGEKEFYDTYGQINSCSFIYSPPRVHSAEEEAEIKNLQEIIKRKRSEKDAFSIRNEQEAVEKVKESFRIKEKAIAENRSKLLEKINPTALQKVKDGFGTNEELITIIREHIKTEFSKATGLNLLKQNNFDESTDLDDETYIQFKATQKIVQDHLGPFAKVKFGYAYSGRKFREATEDDDPELVDCDGEVYDPKNLCAAVRVEWTDETYNINCIARVALG